MVTGDKAYELLKAWDEAHDKGQQMTCWVIDRALRGLKSSELDAGIERRQRERESHNVSQQVT